ncbi:hypothetical protein FB451DRAFT_1559092 [Mycena latifolia]|nr:hypothetical protein FB451DRAFT_1559092 [Mycena latifolia]
MRCLKFLLLVANLAGKAFAATNTSVPVSFEIVLFPAFQALDVFGPLDALNLLFQYPLNLSLIAATLDPVSTAPRSAPHELERLRIRRADAHVRARAAARRADRPGRAGHTSDGPGRHDRLFTRDVPDAAVLRFDILDGKNATTNKRAWNSTVVWGPATNWISHARWVVDGWQHLDHVGREGCSPSSMRCTARTFKLCLNVANGMEYVRVMNSSDDPFAALQL